MTGGEDGQVETRVPVEMTAIFSASEAHETQPCRKNVERSGGDVLRNSLKGAASAWHDGCCGQRCIARDGLCRLSSPWRLGNEYRI